MNAQLDTGTMHLMRLARNGADADGWSKVSSMVMTVMNKVPRELIEIERNEDGSGRCRLTAEGNTVINWL